MLQLQWLVMVFPDGRCWLNFEVNHRIPNLIDTRRTFGHAIHAPGKFVTFRFDMFL